MDPEVEQALAAFAEQDWPRLRLLLHPYLHWTGPDAATVRGRTSVLRLLGDRPELSAPAALELRDGQIDRWQEARRGGPHRSDGQGSPG